MRLSGNAIYKKWFPEMKQLLHQSRPTSERLLITLKGWYQLIYLPPCIDHNLHQLIMFKLQRNIVVLRHFKPNGVLIRDC